MSVTPKHVGQARVLLVQAGAALAAAVFVAGCGAGYRPVVTPINPSGPSAQPTAYAVAVSVPSSSSAGIASVIDYSGDTIMAQAPIGPGPVLFTLDQTGSNGYTLNSDGTLTNFQVAQTQPQAKDVKYTTLPGKSTVDTVLSLFSPTAGLWAADLNGNVADVLSGYPAAYKLAIPLSSNPVMVMGPGASGAARLYAITQNISDPTGLACNTPSAVTTTGIAQGIESSSNTISSNIPLGYCPVFAVQSPDGRRLFVLNRGGDPANLNGSISVINTENNAPDSCTPYQSVSGQWITCHPTIPLPAGPVYAEYVASTQQLVVANFDSNTVSIIDVPTDVYGNDYNTYANGTCSTYTNCGAITGGFGTVYTVKVGANPASVTVLNDASRAYVANQSDGTVSIINLQSHSVVKTLPVNGHPRTVVSTSNSIYGKVYVASPDSPYLTILRTDQDIVDTTVLLQGNILDVRTSNQNGSSGNAIISSRRPGHGQPCNLAPSQLGSGALTLARCQSQIP